MPFFNADQVIMNYKSMLASARLMADPFLHVAISGENISVMVYDGEVGPVELGCQPLLGKSKTHCIANPLTQWSGSHLHAWRQMTFRVALPQQLTAARGGQPSGFYCLSSPRFERDPEFAIRTVSDKSRFSWPPIHFLTMRALCSG